MIISRTPFRVSFFGGGTDYPDWYREHGGAVLATTIDKYCYISVRELPPFFDHRFRIVYSIVEDVKEIDEIRHPAARAVLTRLGVTKGLEIHHDGDLPARSGLGSSSAFTVGLISAIHALEGRYSSKDALASEAIHIEQCVLREAVGVQDQISTAFGGFNYITFRRDGTYQIDPVILPRDRLKTLQDHLMLVFTGVSRIAAEVARTQIDNFKNRVTELRAVQQMVDQAIAILTSPTTDLIEFGRLLHDAWMIKRTLSARVSNATVDHFYDAAIRAGAIGGKLLGAGGGGFMLLFVRPEHRARVAAAFRDRTTVPVTFEPSGSRIVLYQPVGL
ncbi:MAG: kinase [SAR202 cluster bacterium]|jgi:D-glycero-alpha-D-manno-heptose-7-phosphate kinase|nr:kinase [Acidobacteriota bacterium]MDP6419912.1 kinase [SAR202 cluster bacterium]HAL46194.1 kinase [Dehalococcoidia bacterium]MDP6663020.1 kinase [SAR202 cluster bacterium]MQG58421.1 kinase [SAR202 cluster bacterium]|tara:strand:+ start:9059 stop:10054 length:996 start_codon:yes stop_codon:yes gene_type:complete